MDSFPFIEQLNVLAEMLPTKVATFRKESERLYRIQISAQVIIYAISMLTPLIVIFRKSDLYPPQFWVVWCIVTPLLTGILMGMLQFGSIPEKVKLNKRKAVKLGNLSEYLALERPHCTTDEKAGEVYRLAFKEMQTVESEV